MVCTLDIMVDTALMFSQSSYKSCRIIPLYGKKPNSEMTNNVSKDIQLVADGEGIDADSEMTWFIF